MLCVTFFFSGLISFIFCTYVDVDDRIYPRAKSRIGVRYQASVPEWDQCHSPNTSDSPSYKLKKKTEKKKSNKRSGKTKKRER